MEDKGNIIQERLKLVQGQLQGAVEGLQQKVKIGQMVAKIAQMRAREALGQEQSHHPKKTPHTNQPHTPNRKHK